MLDKNKMQQNLVLDRMHIFHCICHHFICCNFIFCIFRIWFNIFLSLLLLLKWRGVNWPKNQMDPLLLELISEQICATRLCNQSESFLKRDKSFADTENDLWEWSLRMKSDKGRWKCWQKMAQVGKGGWRESKVRKFQRETGLRFEGAASAASVGYFDRFPIDSKFPLQSFFTLLRRSSL